MCVCVETPPGECCAGPLPPAIPPAGGWERRGAAAGWLWAGRAGAWGPFCPRLPPPELVWAGSPFPHWAAGGAVARLSSPERTYGGGGSAAHWRRRPEARVSHAAEQPRRRSGTEVWAVACWTGVAHSKAGTSAGSGPAAPGLPRLNLAGGRGVVAPIPRLWVGRGPCQALLARWHAFAFRWSPERRLALES